KQYLARKLGSSTVLSETRYSLICLEITAVIFLSKCSSTIYADKCKLDNTNENNYQITITIEETTSSAKEQRLSSQRSFNSSKRQSSKLSTKINEGQRKRPGSLDLLDIPIETKPIDMEM
ncbi:31845_t:CDS:2, partial [Racocetra persica]